MPEMLQADVPILVETPARPFFPMVRCHYLSIEYDAPRTQWTIGVAGLRMPFLMLGLSGIVQQPFGAARFSSHGLIDSFFQRIEAVGALSINFEDIWLPSFLFTRSPYVGDAYRVGFRLFLLAFEYRDARLSQQEFEANCKHLSEEIVFSEDETRAFKHWTTEQISMAQNQEPKDRRLHLRTSSEQR